MTIIKTIICRLLGHNDRGWYIGENSIRNYLHTNETDPIHYCERCKKGFKDD